MPGVYESGIQVLTGVRPADVRGRRGVGAAGPPRQDGDHHRGRLTSGMIRSPRPTFLAYALLAAVAWSLHDIGIGMAGGDLFREQPLLGVVIGVGLALLISTIIERVRVARERRTVAGSRTARRAFATH